MEWNGKHGDKLLIKREFSRIGKCWAREEISCPDSELELVGSKPLLLKTRVFGRECHSWRMWL